MHGINTQCQQCYQRLVERTHVDPDIAVESLHRQLNEVLQSPRPLSISCVSKTIQSRRGFALELMHYEPYDYDY